MYLSSTGTLGLIRNKKTSRKNTDSVGMNQVCHIKHLIYPHVVLGAAVSMGYNGRNVGAGVSKVALLSLECSSSDYDMGPHQPGKSLHHASILMYVG